jgi:hypothetical protein
MTNQLVEYSWWGTENSPPEHFRTTKQLKELGLVPVAPVGVIHTQKYDLKLYDPENENSVRQKQTSSTAQLAALKKGRERAAFYRALADWDEFEGSSLHDRVNAVRWAQEILRTPQHWRILDTETTGLDDRDRIVEIAVVDLAGTSLLNTLIKPTGEWFMSPGAEAVHGITPDELEEAPTFPEVHAELWDKNPGMAKQQIRFLAPGHKRPEMVAHGVGHWWLGPGLNDFDEHLIQACRNRKRKFQQSDSVGDAKTFLNNMIRNGDWANFALRCDEAKTLREQTMALPVVHAVESRTASCSPFERTQAERRESALGLARYKVSQGLIEQAMAIAQEFGLSRAELRLSDKQLRSIPTLNAA